MGTLAVKPAGEDTSFDKKPKEVGMLTKEAEYNKGVRIRCKRAS